MVPRIFRWPWMSLTLGYAFLGGWRGLLSPSRSVGCWPLRSPVFSNTAMFEEAARELRIPRDPATCSGEDRNTYSPWSQHGSGVHPLFVEDFMVFLTGPCHPLPWNVSQSIFFFRTPAVPNRKRCQFRWVGSGFWKSSVELVEFRIQSK